MKFFFRIIALCFCLSLTVASCSNDEEVSVPYLEVNYASLNGTWMLTEWRGAPLEEGQYVYITFDRKEHTFVMYENMGSMYSHESTGSFEVEEDDELGTVLTGEYDYDNGSWNTYIVTEMTATTMKWTVKGDAEDVSVYTRCPEIPEDILAGSRSIVHVAFSVE
ncbi:lipocalin family protein [uncultured Bacteroides sp.]|uniref:lipocalin family protein n=1 Tax=uncultured Bacteroides sp. TaxID=162156 RepID=UPI002674DE5C|nr:lipocalin family protein [uncultured Bacteroides sp.]